MTDSINKKLHVHDKMDNINAKLDEFSYVLKNQLSFNKMIETQLAQIAAAIPSYEKDRIPSKPEGTMETMMRTSLCHIQAKERRRSSMGVQFIFHMVEAQSN